MRKILLVEAIREGIEEEMSRDDKIIVMGESIRGGTFGMTAGLEAKFGTERVLDTPLSEHAIAGVACGAALAGYRPIVDLMCMSFLYACADEAIWTAPRWRFVHGGVTKCPVVFMGSAGGGSRTGGDHSAIPAAAVMHNPGMKVVLPSTPYDAKGLIKTAIRDNNPVCVFIHVYTMMMRGEVPEEEYLIPFGSGDIKRTGKDITVIATSFMVHKAMSVAEKLKDKIDIEVVDPRTLIPLDMDTIIKSVKKTGRVVIVDEDHNCCGVGAEIGMRIMETSFDSLDAPIQRVCLPNYPLPGGVLEDKFLPQEEDIVRAIHRIKPQ